MIKKSKHNLEKFRNFALNTYAMCRDWSLTPCVSMVTTARRLHSWSSRAGAEDGGGHIPQCVSTLECHKC